MDALVIMQGGSGTDILEGEMGVCGLKLEACYVGMIQVLIVPKIDHRHIYI